MIAWPRLVVRRTILVLFGVFLFVVLVEGVLRIGSLFVGRELAQRPEGSGKWRMLSLGDSNTYGLYLDKAQAYPMVFERLWNAQRENVKGNVEVFNLGFPGTNSSKVVKDFGRMLRSFRPALVTVMVGANDFWTVPETAADSPGLMERLTATLWRISRAYRLFHIAVRGLEMRQLNVSEEKFDTFEHGRGTVRFGDEEFDLGWQMLPEGGLPGWEPMTQLKRDLETIVKRAGEYGVDLVLLTYPADAGFYSLANSTMREVAKATDTPLIDLAAQLKSACPVPAGSTALKGPGATCPELFPDQHPTALGHQRVAGILMEQLRPLLE